MAKVTAGILKDNPMIEKDDKEVIVPLETFKNKISMSGNWDEREYDSALRSFKTFTDEQLKSYGLRMYQPNVDPRIKKAYDEEKARRGL